MSKLNLAFYTGPDVKQIARDLLGKKLCTRINGELTSGLITETEAYEGAIDKASHAYGGRYTNRTKTLYLAGGVGYVYLCYGIHHLFNVVTSEEGVPHAVLIRAVRPLEGIDIMLRRRNKTKADITLTAGPGAMSQALGIRTIHNGALLSGDTIWIEETGITYPRNRIIRTTRVGVDYAGEHALWPYRYYIRDEAWVSRK